MSSFNFPLNPTEGQIYAPAGGPQYVYRAPYWRASGRVDTIVAETPPTGPKNGQLWFNSSTGNTYIWYVDADSGQWVQINVGDTSGSLLSPKSRGAAGDGVTNDDAAVAQIVAEAFAGGLDVYWDAGTYLTTLSIPNLHRVRHSGPGAIKRASNLFYPCPRAGQVNTIYCGPAGADTNDGLSGNERFREIRAATAILDNYGPALDGVWNFSAIAGTYKGGIVVPRSISPRDFVKITGAGGAHPAVPTVIIDKAADSAQTYGVLTQDYNLLWLENLKFIGGFDQGVTIRGQANLQSRNVHVTGTGKASGTVGFNVMFGSTHCIIGGILDSLYTGVEEIFGVQSAFSSAGSLAAGPVIRNCGIGVKRKEATGGHLDYINFEDNDVDVEIHATCNANISGASFKRSKVGIVLVGPSEVHSFESAVWGTGADAPLLRLKKVGNGTVLGQTGWTTDAGPTIRTGFGRVGDIAHAFGLSVSHTGTVAATVVYTLVNVLRPGVYSAEGANIRVRAFGTLAAAGAATVGTITVFMQAGSVNTAGLVIPAGITVSGTRWQMEWEMYCSADGDFQRTAARGSVGSTTIPPSLGASTASLDDAQRSVALRVTLGNAGDTFILGDIVVEG